MIVLDAVRVSWHVPGLQDCEGGVSETEPETHYVQIDTLVLDERCQVRVERDPDAIAEYAEAYLAEADMPPIDAFMVDGAPWVVDGIHRVDAQVIAGREWIRYRIVGKGSEADAIWYSLSTNATNGLRRTNADKRKAVRMAFESEIGSGQSSRAIAEHIGVSPDFVARVRVEWDSERPATCSDASDDFPKRRDSVGRMQPARRTTERAPSRTTPTSFSRDECSGVVELFRVIRRGGDVRTIANAPALIRIERKFASMLTTLESK